MAVAAPLVFEADPTELVIERGEDRHRPYVVGSWIKSYQALMPPYAKTYGLGRWGWTTFVADRLIARGARLLVARLQGYPDAYLGWICGEPGMLHYCYVSHQARRQRVATQLLEQMLWHVEPVRRITHRPVAGRGGMRAKCQALGWRYEALTKEELER